MDTTIESDDTIIQITKKPNVIKKNIKSTESSFSGTGGGLDTAPSNKDDAIEKENAAERKENNNNNNLPKSATRNDKTRRELREKWTKYARYFKRMYDYLVRAEMMHPYINRAKDIAVKYKANGNSLQQDWAAHTCRMKNGATYEAVRESINAVVKSSIKMNSKNISFMKLKDSKDWERFNEDILNTLRPAESLMDVKTKENEVRCGGFTTNARALTNLVAEICNDKFFTYTISDIFKMHLIPLLKTLVNEANNMADNPGYDPNSQSLTAVSDCVVMVKSIVETLKVCIGAPLQVAEAALKKTSE